MRTSSPAIFGIIGWKNTGKTTLISALVEHMRRNNYRISVIKHTHHNVDLDHEGSDSYRHRQAGAQEVILASSSRWFLTKELRGKAAPSLPELAARMEPVDIILVEGFKGEPHPKIEVFRADLHKQPLAAIDDTIVALAGDKVANLSLPQFSIDQFASIANFITDHLGIIRR